MSNNYIDISNNLSIDIQIPLKGTMNMQGHIMITRRKLAQNLALDLQLALETQKIRVEGIPLLSFVPLTWRNL